MTVQDTSLEAYEAIKPTLTDRQKQVLAVLKRCDCMCNYQIAQQAGLAINCITNRVGELLKKGEIVQDGKKRPGPPSGRNVYYWRAVKAKTLF